MTRRFVTINGRSSLFSLFSLNQKNRRIIIFALVALSLAILLQLLPTIECTKAKSSDHDPEGNNDNKAKTTTVQPKKADSDDEEEEADEEVEDEPPDKKDKEGEKEKTVTKKDDKKIKSKSTTTTVKSKKVDEEEEDEDDDDEKEDEREEEMEDDDEQEQEGADEAESKSGAKTHTDNVKKETDSVDAGEANENSGVEKGTKTELPKTDTTLAPGKLKKDGIILHSDNPKAKAQEVDKKSISTNGKPKLKPKTTTTTTMASKSKETASTTRIAKSVKKGAAKIDENEEEAESRSATDSLNRILGESRSASVASTSTSTSTPKVSSCSNNNSSTTLAPSKKGNETTANSSSRTPSPANGTKTTPSSSDGAKEDSLDNANSTSTTTSGAAGAAAATTSKMILNSEDVMKQPESSERAKKRNLNEKTEHLESETKQLDNANSATTTTHGDAATATAAAAATTATNTMIPNSEDVIKQLESSEGAKNRNLKEKIEHLETETKQLDKEKNTTITINGRKFDQVGSIECVDEKFYNLLLHDLSLIDVNMRRDFYGTYYDYEYAKAVQAIVDTPVLTPTEHPRIGTTFGMEQQQKQNNTNPSDNTARKTGSVAADDPHLDVKKLDVLADLRKFWNQTYVTYTRNKSKLDKSCLPMAGSGLGRNERRRRSLSALASEKKPVQTNALENYRYLLRRLEELKVMILNGEEALIVMNNRVKKLNQVVGEPDLQKALCNCITSRSGRAAFSMMNELFVDKNSDKLIKNIGRAKIRAKDAALDTAEFCAYWYGDTIRSQAVQKEKQIKKLVLSIVRERTQADIEKKFVSNRTAKARATTATASAHFTARLNKTEVITEEHTVIKNGIKYHQIKRRIVTKIIQMTSLWLPRLANWIKKALNTTSEANQKPEMIAKLIRKQESSNNKTMSIDAGQVDQALKEGPPQGKTRKRRQDNYSSEQLKQQQQHHEDQKDSYMTSSPFDKPDTYADVDDPMELDSSAILQSFIANNYMADNLMLQHSRLKRDVSSTTTTTTSSKPTLISSSSTSTLAPSSRSPASVLTTSTSMSPIIGTSAGPNDSQSETTTTTTSKPKTVAAKQTDMISGEHEETAEEVGDFETRIAERTSKCAVDGFSELLKIGFDQNALMYESNSINANEPYIVTLRETFSSSFASAWAQKRDAWSKHLAGNESSSSSGAVNSTFSSSSSSSSSSSTSTSASNRNQSEMPLAHHDDRSIDEEIDNSFESTYSSYDRGARMGYTIGKFIGDKAARQWPDPAELNTFTYDSLFLAGVGYGHDEEKSRQLERHIVEETAKRVAFTEANRQAFAKSLRTAYLNGAFIVPLFGILHAQRSVAKRTAEEAAKVGFEAAAKAAEEFAPKSVKFIEMHQHQRSLAAPYKSNKRLSDKWEGLMDQIKSVQLESELSRNITKLAIDCGQKSATLMGALLGLIVTPEAFETYTRFRGSLEALESEFNQYKLGALRGYELGESWAYLNYTSEMNQNLRAMKSNMKGPEGSSRAASQELLAKPPSSSSGDTADESKATPEVGVKPTNEETGQSSSWSNQSEEVVKNKDKATRTVAAKVAQDQARELARKSSASSLFEPDQSASDKKTNTNNIFQYMVLNYGTHVVANHTRKHMLKLRSLYIDDDLLRDLKYQSGDLIADLTSADSEMKPNQDQQQKPIEPKDNFEELFEGKGGNYIGELKGMFNNPSNTRNVPLKFNIIDLGPLLEFVDELEDQKDLDKSPSAQMHNSKSSTDNNNNNSTSSDGGNSSSKANVTVATQNHLKSTPITSAISSKVGKVFLKFNVARRKKKPHTTSSSSDAVAMYLNSQDFDEGDGYMCGTFSRLTTVKEDPAHGDGSSQPGTMVDDDLSLEAMMLDELFDRIEAAPLSLGTVELTENVMGMTTLSPKRVDSIKSSTTLAPQIASTTTTTTTPSSSSTTSSSTRRPTSKQTTLKAESTTMKPIGSSRSAKISKSWLEKQPTHHRGSKMKTTTTTTESPDETQATESPNKESENETKETDDGNGDPKD